MIFAILSQDGFELTVYYQTDHSVMTKHMDFAAVRLTLLRVGITRAGRDTLSPPALG